MKSLAKQIKLEEYRRLHNPGKATKELRKASRLPLAHGEISHKSAKDYNRQKEKLKTREYY